MQAPAVDPFADAAKQAKLTALPERFGARR